MSERALFELRYQTPSPWLEAVLADFDTFLADHATCEKKASGMAMSMISHYPNRPQLIEAMLDLAVEELQHFRQVSHYLYQRGRQLQADEKDSYVNRLRQAMRAKSEHYLLDRLLIGSIIEKRGVERFGLIAAALPDGEALQLFYAALTRSEERHYEIFYRLAEGYFAADCVAARTAELLDIEAQIVASLPFRAALH
ncbi:tRNA-(ms[2]io[6]A)-hydroxylase [Ectothiorhodospiraceae bacterium BW-2]|nr:tRNA-(ms[2]io[6]A)-hydroxylase [Ectothiorhodospiraceae bacterium BW-2]